MIQLTLEECREQISLKYGFSNWAELYGDAVEGLIDSASFLAKEQEAYELFVGQVKYT